jgi:hypothetical protein
MSLTARPQTALNAAASQNRPEHGRLRSSLEIPPFSVLLCPARLTCFFGHIFLSVSPVLILVSWGRLNRSLVRSTSRSIRLNAHVPLHLSLGFLLFSLSRRPVTPGVLPTCQNGLLHDCSLPSAYSSPSQTPRPGWPSPHVYRPTKIVSDLISLTSTSLTDLNEPNLLISGGLSVSCLGDKAADFFEDDAWTGRRRQLMNRVYPLPVSYTRACKNLCRWPDPILTTDDRLMTRRSIGGSSLPPISYRR